MKIYRTTEQSGYVYPPAHSGDAGYDVAIPESYAGMVIHPHTCIVIDTGICIVPPEGYYIRVEPRSSRFLRGLVIHGILDGGYRGTIKLLVWNISQAPYKLEKNERLAQLIVTLANTPELEYYSGVPDGDMLQTSRKDKGIGSTDR